MIKKIMFVKVKFNTNKIKMIHSGTKLYMYKNIKFIILENLTIFQKNFLLNRRKKSYET